MTKEPKTVLHMPTDTAAPELGLSTDAQRVLDAIYRLYAKAMLPDLPEDQAVEHLRQLHGAGCFQIIYDDAGAACGLRISEHVLREQAAQRDIADLLHNLVMQKKAGPSLHKLRRALVERDLANFEMKPNDDRALAPALAEILEPTVGVFVVEHNWAAAFASAEIGDKPEFKLPYPVCCFEFKISGRNVCAVLSERLGLTIAVETSRGWHNIDPTIFGSQKGLPARYAQYPSAEGLRKFVSDQVNAILVALDSGVVETSVVRPSEKLNKALGKRGRQPHSSYHVVRLARERVAPTDARGHSDRQGPRLHFRRGHWRATDHGKTWINWTLVGDPDLGFIEKHYRL